MKRSIYILFLVPLFCNAQNGVGEYGTVSKQFKDFYNANAYDSIFGLYDEGMKNAVPHEKSEAFFESVALQFGELIDLNLSGTDKNYRTYRAKFKNGTMDFVLSLNEDSRITGFQLKPYKPDNLPKLERNSTKMILPFKEEWFVFWGGVTNQQNYHMDNENQQYAYDILMVRDSSSFKKDGKKNSDYYVFGKKIIAPCDAEVVKVITGVKDNVPGELNPKQLTGNTIVLKTDKDEYLLFAHLKEGSIKVDEGETVKQGQVMARCGNSGNSTEPHLHLQLQNVADFFQATGAKLYFDKILVNGKIKEKYMPLKEDFVKNIK